MGCKVNFAKEGAVGLMEDFMDKTDPVTVVKYDITVFKVVRGHFSEIVGVFQIDPIGGDRIQSVGQIR
jgi:hypothetical protein